MSFQLVPLTDTKAVDLPHFPTRMQAFLFRASEFFTFEKIAQILETDAATVKTAAAQMGIYHDEPSDIWRRRGYITIIKAMWHLLPYSQLLALLEMSEAQLAVLLKEDDFLAYKLNVKPPCEPLKWRVLTDAELVETGKIKRLVDSVKCTGKKPFSFEYIYPKITFGGREKVKTRMIYLFSGLYQTAFDVDSESYCSDELLQSYQSLGINAVWTQGTLYSLTPFPFDPKLSAGYRARQENLRKFAARCAKYGIKVYLYLNEPRYMEASFFEKYPHLKGHDRGNGQICMCTSVKEVQDYLKNSVEALCRAVPDFGGFVTITRSENLTNCYSHANPTNCNCPRCKERSMGEVIGNVIRCFREGADRVNPQLNIMVWSWGWREHAAEIIPHLPSNIIFMSQSESGKKICIGGVENTVIDYSMGNIGPSEGAKREWELARQRGLSLGAKVQINTTWEGSTVPALPVFPLVNQHLSRLEQEGIEHYMLSWTLGGFPSENILYAAPFFRENAVYPPPSENLTRACELFSEALRHFPFHLRVIYNGPQNGGPSNLLFREPTGYASTMTCFAYDDLDGWRANYPRDVFLNQFALLCEKWEQGLAYIEKEPQSQTKTMAYAAYCIYRSGLDQIRFYMAREAQDIVTMRQCAKRELETAGQMLALMNENAAIGYEAANHYYFSRFGILEKMLNCQYLIETL